MIKTFFQVEMPKVFGYTNTMIVSGSMSPILNLDDIIFTHEEDAYQLNDIILYKQDSGYIAHRVVGFKNSGIITKGDMNNSEDPWLVSADQIQGKVVFTLPNLGSLYNWSISIYGLATIILLLLFFLLLSLLNSFFKKMRITSSKKKIFGVTFGVLLTIILQISLVYTTTSKFNSAESAQDSARTTTFVLNNSGEGAAGFSDNWNPGDEKTYTINIKNFNSNYVNPVSEVEQRYIMTIQTDGRLPLQYELSIVDPVTSDKGHQLSAGLINLNKNYALLDGGYIPASNVQITHQYRLTIRWLSGDQYKSADYQGLSDSLKLQVISEQID